MQYAVSLPIGHFITHDIWVEALELVKYQATQREKNKHYNTLSMYYYGSVLTEANKLKEQSYFENRVSNDLFYGLSSEFAVFTYLMPKQALGLRSYKFFSYPMRALYYAIGLYLVKL